MSYILAALKKAESERREQSSGVGVSPMVEPNLADKTSSGPALILVGAVIILFALVTWLLLVGWAGPKVLVVAKPTSAIVELPASNRSVGFTNSREVGSIRPVIAPKQKAMSAQNSVFDSIDIKGHLYVATRPSLRKVVINDSTLREGDKVDGILVEEITETGVILSFEGVEKTISAY
jgi:hypothetical protein